MKEKFYEGFGRSDVGGPRVIWVQEMDSKTCARVGWKRKLTHQMRHSPDGFNWGYGGSGPADTALSILADCLGLEIAEKYYQRFKQKFIAPAGDHLYIREKWIREWLEEVKK